RAATLLHHGPCTPRLDGNTGDWEGNAAFVAAGNGGSRGKVAMTHDDKHLYLGLSAEGPAVGAARDTRLELTLTHQQKVMRWAVTVAPDGDVVWEGLGSAIPPGVRAAVQRRLLDGALTVELAVPLAPVLGDKDARQTDLGRLGVHLGLTGDGGDLGRLG